MATIGISERNMYVFGIEEKSDNVQNFLLYWTTYNNYRDMFTYGYQKYANNRVCWIERELIKDERNIQIPKIYVASERSVMLFPICSNERQCVYKRYYIDDSDRKINIIPICSNERLVEFLYWYSESDKRNSFVKYGGSDVREIITKLPPHFTAYNYRKILCNYIPPNTDERKIHYFKYHDKYNLPTTFCDGNDYNFNINVSGCGTEIIDSHTVTEENSELNFIGIDDGFDFGELFIVDKFNNLIHNLSLDSLFTIPIYDHGAPECYSKELYMVSNQDNLFIRLDLIVDVDECKDLYPTLYQQVVDKYPDNEDKQRKEFNIECMKKFLSNHAISVRLMDKDISYDWEFYRKFPMRFLNKFEISLSRDYLSYIYGVTLTFYFPYRFTDMSKKRMVTLAFLVV